MSEVRGLEALRGNGGFSTVELMIAIAVIFILISMAVPVYRSAVQEAEVSAAVSDLQSMSNAIETYALQHGTLPASLQDVGYEFPKDPWGREYVYTPFLEDEVVASVDGGAPADMVAELESFIEAEMAVGRDQPEAVALLEYMQGAEIVEIGGGGGEETSMIEKRKIGGTPINSDFDFFSVGLDGKSNQPINSGISRDDVIRAENGDYFGLAGTLAGK